MPSRRQAQISRRQEGDARSWRSLGCFFLLGVGAQLPWSVSALILPWLLRAAQQPPTPAQTLLNGLPSLLQGSLSLGNLISIAIVVGTRATERISAFFTVPFPLALCAAVLFLSASDAALDASGAHPLSGLQLTYAAIPLSLLVGGFASLLGCGCASLASTGATMRVYVIGQSVAQLVSALLSFIGAALQADGTAADPLHAARALAQHAEFTLLISGAVMLLCCVAYALLPPDLGHEIKRPSRRPPPPPPLAPLPAVPASEEAPLDAADPSAAILSGLCWSVPNATPEEVVEEVEEACSHQSNAFLLVDELSEPLLGYTRPPPAASAALSPLLCFKLSLFFTACVTLALYPGITSFLRPADTANIRLAGLTMAGRLLVPSTFLVYAAGELGGRLSATCLPEWLLSARHLLALSLSRFVLAPALLMCNVRPPSGRWAVPGLLAQSDLPPLLILLLLAASNGFVTAQALHKGPWAAAAGEGACGGGRGGVTTALLGWLVGGVMCGSAAGMVLALVLQT